MRTLQLLFWFSLSLAPPALAGPVAADSSAAVILAYSRIGEDAYPANNLPLEQFEEHIAELSGGLCTVLPLAHIVTAFRQKESLPPYMVAITFEGGYKSILERAVPLLLENNLPFTIFYAASQADDPGDQYLNWEELKKLKSNPLVTLGILPPSYARLADESRETALAELNKARLRHRENFAENAQFFSYPFGEYDLALRNLIEEQKFEAGLGLQSGVAHAGSDLYALPRFTMTEPYGNLERFRLVTNALPLPVSNIEPADPMLATDTPLIGFTLEGSLQDQIDSLSCFMSGQKDISMEKINNRVELRQFGPLSEERTRINCTLPVQEKTPGDEPRWRWFGMMLVNKGTETGPNPEPAALP